MQTSVTKETSIEPTFQRNQYLDNHKMNNTGEMTHNCNLCHESFPKIEALEFHARSHAEEKPYKCNLCHKSFAKKRYLKRHIIRYTGQIPFKCCVCEKLFVAKQKFESHVRYHAQEMPYKYKCDFCDKAFTNQEDLDYHRNNHNEEMPFKCNRCHKVFAENHNLQSHVRVHAQERPYKCDICEEAFKKQEDVDYHRREHTEDVPFKCSLCHKAFPVIEAAEFHARSHTHETPYRCNYCGIAFALMQSLEFHANSHTEDKSYKCNLCDKAFALKKQLENHSIIHVAEHKCPVCHVPVVNKQCRNEQCPEYQIGTHTSEEPFKRKRVKASYECNICHKVFAIKKMLENHKRIHAMENQCSLCHAPLANKQCTNKQCLQYEVRSHTGERRFTCYSCGEIFEQIHILKAHLLTHIRENQFKRKHLENTPYKCNVCHKVSAQWGHLESHLKSHDTGVTPATYKSSYVWNRNIRLHIGTHSGETLYTVYMSNNADKSFGNSSETGMNLSAESGNCDEGKEMSALECVEELSSGSIEIPEERFSSEDHFSFDDDVDDLISTAYGCGLCDEMFAVEKEFTEHCCNHYSDDPQKDTLLEHFQLHLLGYFP